MSLEIFEKIADMAKQLVEAQKKVLRESGKRQALPPGSTRAKVTTANARWMAICEERDRLEEELRQYVGSIWFPF